MSGLEPVDTGSSRRRRGDDGEEPTQPTLSRPSGPARARDGEEISQSAALFALAWGCAGVLDQLIMAVFWVTEGPVSSALGVAVLVAAIGTIRRRSAIRFALLCLLWAAHLCYQLPLILNHHVAQLAINLTMLVALVGLMARRRTLPVPLGDAYRVLAPVVRLQLVLVYVISALHKLNWDYFDPAVSCSAVFSRGIAAGLRVPFPEIASTMSIWGSLALEIGIPALLAFRRTRLIGVAVGSMFHLVLAFDWNMAILGFSCTVAALYVLFIPPKAAATILRFDWLPVERRARMVAEALLVLSSILLAVVFSFGHKRAQDPASALSLAAPLMAGMVLTRMAGYLFTGAGLLAVGHVLARGVRVGSATPPFRMPWSTVPLLVFPLLLVANGMGPYLGYKTVPAFSMFSNLRTEDGRTNHMFLGVHGLAPLQNDLVEIVDSSSERLRAMGAGGLRITYFELRRLLSGDMRRTHAFVVVGRPTVAEVAAPGFWIDYRHRGHTVHVARADASGHEVFQRHGWFLSKLVAFRLVHPNDRPVDCKW